MRLPLLALQAARRHAHRIACASNLRQLATGAFVYTEDHKGVFMTHNGGAFSRLYTNRMVDGPFFRDQYMRHLALLQIASSPTIRAERRECAQAPAAR